MMTHAQTDSIERSETTQPIRVVLWRFVRRFRREWKPGWIRDDNGEVFRASFIRTHGRIVVRTHIGRMVEGYGDSTTSRKQIAAWWPDSSNTSICLTPDNEKR